MGFDRSGLHETDGRTESMCCLADFGDTCTCRCNIMELLSTLNAQSGLSQVMSSACRDPKSNTKPRLEIRPRVGGLATSYLYGVDCLNDAQCYVSNIVNKSGCQFALHSASLTSQFAHTSTFAITCKAGEIRAVLISEDTWLFVCSCRSTGSKYPLIKDHNVALPEP